MLNNVALKMTPSQHEEIAKQVQELLDQGLIRKSVSPCAMTTILVPNKVDSSRMFTYLGAINKITIR